MFDIKGVIQLIDENIWSKWLCSDASIVRQAPKIQALSMEMDSWQLHWSDWR